MLISLKGARCFREEMTMDRLVAMETFVRIIEAGSFSGAAKQLRVGQPAVSKTIAQLEDRLGVRLLLRSTHGLTPTEAGRNFYERAKRSIEEAEEAELAARGAAAALGNTIDLAVDYRGKKISACPYSRGNRTMVPRQRPLAKSNATTSS
jgi:molybdenum-dependent DNA-binding transcriptional regulator ModE